MEEVFLGSEALARKELTGHELRTHHRRLLPGVAAPFRTLRLTRKRWSDEVDEEPELGWWPSAPRTR